jgi:hypothetical protein
MIKCLHVFPLELVFPIRRLFFTTHSHVKNIGTTCPLMGTNVPIIDYNIDCELITTPCPFERTFDSMLCESYGKGDG